MLEVEKDTFPIIFLKLEKMLHANVFRGQLFNLLKYNLPPPPSPLKHAVFCSNRYLSFFTQSFSFIKHYFHSSHLSSGLLRYVGLYN